MIGAARNNLGMRLLTDFYFSRVCVVTDDASKQQRSNEVRELFIVYCFVCQKLYKSNKI